jgi:ABC-type multidrug transport system fused ATPase/permease subunit
MKRMTKLFSFFLACLMLVSLVQVTKVEAANGELAGEVKSDFAKAISDLQTTELMGGVTLYKQQIETLYNGITDKTNPKYKWNPHTVQWVDLPATSENVNVVVWTDGGKHGWASSTVRNTAKDFEEKNPGWIVVAAVNGDFFDINGSKEPTNISVQNGEVYQPKVLNNYRKGIGFNSGDFKDVIYGDKTNPRLKGVSFTLENNAINAITGLTGAGKSGVVDLLLKLNRQHEGEINFGEIGGFIIN